MMNKVFTGKEDIKEFIPTPEFRFSYDIDPELWYRRHENSRYDTYPLTFFNYFYSLDTLEKIGGNGVWIVSKSLDYLTKLTWEQTLTKECLRSKSVSNEAFCRDGLLEAGISEDILTDDRMRLFRYDGAQCCGLGPTENIFAVVGIAYQDEFIPIWWDPFGHFKF